MKYRERVIVRGGGDVASGTIHRLHQAGYQVMVLETKNPTAIRRTVAFSQAIFDGETVVEGTVARLCHNMEEAEEAFEKNKIPVVIDAKGEMIKRFKPEVVVDAILAKKNLGTTREMAQTVIALGPGFTAGNDVDVVIETNRGHDLARVIYKGQAEPNTGIPGDIAAFSKERVNHAPVAGVIRVIKDIDELVEKGEIMAEIDHQPVVAGVAGLIRGMIQNGTMVHKGMKIADVDPRGTIVNCHTISDKARAIGGSVLEVILHRQIR